MQFTILTLHLYISILQQNTTFHIIPLPEIHEKGLYRCFDTCASSAFEDPMWQAKYELARLHVQGPMALESFLALTVEFSQQSSGSSRHE